MSRILLTGATGFVGRSLVPALVQAGHEVRCAVSRKLDWLVAEQVLVDPLETHKDWSHALQGIELVIHLAARVHVMADKAQSPLDEYDKVNSLATKNLAEQAAEHQVTRFIFLSSIKVNGEYTLPGAPFREEHPSQPEDPYGQSKLHAEQYLQAIAEQSSMEVVILRPPLIYGPGVKANFLKMLRWVDKGIPLPFGKVENKRHFLFIDNLISAIQAVMTAPEAANQTYLLADDEALSLTALMNVIAQEMHVPTRLLPIPVGLLRFVFKCFGLTHLNTRLFSSLEVDNNKIKSQLDWTPPVSPLEGLGATVRWYRYEHKA